MDYKRENGLFQVTVTGVTCVTIWNPGSLSSSGAQVDPDSRSWKKLFSERISCQKAIEDLYFTKKWRAETLQPDLQFDNFKPQLESDIFRCISWLNGTFFWGWWWGFLKDGVQINLMASMSPFNSPALSSVFPSIVYGWNWRTANWDANRWAQKQIRIEKERTRHCLTWSAWLVLWPRGSSGVIIGGSFSPQARILR